MVWSPSVNQVNLKFRSSIFYCPVVFSVTQKQLYEISEESTVYSILKLPGIRKWMVDYALSSDNVKNFIQRNDLRFDLVINEEFFQEAFSVFAYKYKSPLITISTTRFSYSLYPRSQFKYSNIQRHLWEFRFFRSSNGATHTMVACSQYSFKLYRQNDIHAAMVQCIHFNYRFLHASHCPPTKSSGTCRKTFFKFVAIAIN